MAGDNKKNGKKRQQRQKSKEDDGDIDDDEFARIQAKIMKNKESKQRSKMRLGGRQSCDQWL